MSRCLGDTRGPRHARDFPDLSRLKAVLFDLGGTLWDPFDGADRESAVGEAVRAAADSLGLGEKAADVAAALLESLGSLREKQRLALDDCFADPALREGNLEEMAAWAMDKARVPLEVRPPAFRVALALGKELSKPCRLYDDTLSALESLRASRPDLSLGIVSNTVVQPEIIDCHLAECGLKELVDFRVLSSEVGWRKPHPAIYSAALVRAGARPEETLFAGDRLLEDVAGPKRLGMMTALCRDFEDPLDAPTAAVPDIFAPDLWVLVRMLAYCL